MSFITRALRSVRPMANAMPLASSLRGSTAMTSMSVNKLSATRGLIRNYSSQHDEETYEEFTVRYEKEFDEAYDLFEVQRVLNNVFSYDLVPAPSVLAKALQAARRVNDYATASRVFEGLRYKVESKDQYDQYLEELKPLREELGITLKEELFAEA